MATDVNAHLRNCGISAQKVRLVIDAVRGKKAVEALGLLQFMPQAASRQVRKLLVSAIANAEENFGLSRDNLFVSEIKADEGRTRRWRRFGARGRFKPILRRTSHISIVLREQG